MGFFGETRQNYKSLEGRKVFVEMGSVMSCFIAGGHTIYADGLVRRKQKPPQMFEEVPGGLYGSTLKHMRKGVMKSVSHFPIDHGKGSQGKKKNVEFLICSEKLWKIEIPEKYSEIFDLHRYLSF
jgi:hypothetical protein